MSEFVLCSKNVLVHGVKDIGDIENSSALKEAYELGAQIIL